MARTTINIKKEVRDALAKKRKYSRETYDEVLERLLNKDLAKTKRKLK
jgi:predicted transcriptional regulator